MTSRLSESSDEEQPKHTVPLKKQKRVNYVSTTDQIPNKRRKTDNDDQPELSVPVNIFEPKSNTIEPPVGGYGKASKMLEKYGFKSGEGLGKHKQGRVEPVGLSTQQGRRGIGFAPISQGGIYEGPGWTPEKEVIRTVETPIWLTNSIPEQLEREELEDGMSIGEPKMTIHDEDRYCDPEVLNNILSLKTLFDKISKEKLRTLVGRCNMYETIENAFFLNRAALKMANIDAAFDFMFTNPLKEDDSIVVESDQLLYFADVCAGPGGFTEYVLWRKHWRAKGFGFTLRGNNDFKLSSMHAASIESFFPYYGEADDGDIFNPNNLISLKKHVLQNTDDMGVHFLMADGGFSVEGEENIQEIKSKQLYLCQCIAALSLVREGGHFVVKLFDTFTEFSVGLLYLMYRSFKKICIHKPVTSRPANSERYLICKWKRSDSDTIERYLFHINQKLWDNSQKRRTDQDVTKLVSSDVIESDKNFYKYICNANDRIGREQIISLLKINECNKNSCLLDDLVYDGNFKYEEKRNSIRKECLEYWKIPDEKRKTAKKPTLKEQLAVLKEKIKIDDETLQKILSYTPRSVTTENGLKDVKQRDIIESVYDWYYMYCDNPKDVSFNFYLGGQPVYKYDGKRWSPTQNILLPEGTLILAEDVEEMRGQGKGTHRSHSIHIIDAFSLGPKLVYQVDSEWRNKYIKAFCKSLKRPSYVNDGKSYYPIRCKKIYELSNLNQEKHRLHQRTLKNSQVALTTSVPDSTENLDLYYVVNSLLVFKFCKDPWITSYSKNQNLKYYFDKLKGMQTYKLTEKTFNKTPDSLVSSFRCPILGKDNYTESFSYLLGLSEKEYEIRKNFKSHH